VRTFQANGLNTSANFSQTRGKQYLSKSYTQFLAVCVDRMTSAFIP